MNDRDKMILLRIIRYSEEIFETITRLDLNFEKFENDHIAKNAISMCILQIGESAGKLSEIFKKNYNDMPWHNIIAMRNRAAHAYDSFDAEIMWITITEKIPELMNYCISILTKK